ncbi:PREDICTED: pentatricopeptide repeat-containing protein At4g32450, mitochondrial-like [Nelumbo nucifera]|uniref:Pentatricopeptide repeat-containing protein At4g32450, mitochondrial-like n=2 Tax=Nelumbo nucifera TaxID=4432 RepID=A0A1U7ZFA6_NELNU|nr:PREDICTED: pentatricopeptide repeat-containing protein At4g32450, mitochondrial-like [Nelumbo nucifera]DAD38882.1 TPA_asm: hypothetical protein HUJ06_013204 [Nelumbo nucifera]
MSRKRSVLRAVKSVATTLSKVHSSSHLQLSSSNGFVDSIKTLPLVKQISTNATEIADFQAEHHGTRESANAVGFQHKFTGYGSFRETSFDYHSSANGFYGDGSREFQQGSDGFYKETQKPREFQQNPSSGGSHGRNPSWVQSNVNEYYGEKPSHNLDGSYRECPGGVYGENHGQNPNGFYRENPREEEFQPNPVEQNKNFNGFYRKDFQQLATNPTGFYSKSSNTLQQGPSGYYGQNNYQQNLHGSRREDVRETQQKPTGFYQGSPSTYQGSGGPSYRSDFGGCQQGPSGYYRQSVGEHQQSSSGFQGETTNLQGVNSLKPEGGSVETAESSQYSGTIEELDDLCREGKMKGAVEVLGLLEKQHINVDLERYLQLIQTCGEFKALQEAKVVHEHLTRSWGHVKVSINNKILEMYSKCGSMSNAYELFEKMQERNLTSWDTMIFWLAKNGLGEDAIDMFTRFKEAGLKPDGQMFIGVFYACGVLGDIDEGMLHFESMSKDYGIMPSMDHYVSVVEMLGSTGYLDEAMEFIEKMPLEPSIDVWETLMNLSRVHGHMELGDHCAELVGHLDPSRMTDELKVGLVPIKPSDLAEEKEKKKLSAQNLLEVRSRVHEYRAGDTSHPEKDKIYALLKGMATQMRESGYIPETRFVLHDIDQESKEDALLAHSERLAVAYGLISSAARSQIRIIKNLRVCGDCHSALKIMSKLVGREFIIRDAKRFHHFKDGLCSCRDFW